MRLSAGGRPDGRLPAAFSETLTALPPILPASALFTQAEMLLPATIVGLTNPLVHLDARTLGLPAFARWLHATYAARDEPLPPVLLGRYAPATLLDGESPSLVLTAGALVAEQVPHAGENLDALVASLHTRASRAVVVDRPCLLACRFGEWTWGHWLLDMLPKIVLAERQAPQRFTYAVPFGIVDESFGPYTRSVLESLAAYGVDPSRLLRVHPGAIYRFDSLFDIAGVSGKALHPGVLDAMRRLPAAPAKRRALTAVLRAPPSIRCLANHGPVRDMLSRHAAVALNALSASFADQVAAFRDSSVIVGDLGSNLAAMIYAEPGTGLVTLAPAVWYDDYFPKLFQRLGILVADVRGYALPSAGQPFHHASVAIGPAGVEAGLHAVQAAPASGQWHTQSQADGRVIARAPGRIVAEITFGKDGNAALFQLENFAAPEATRTWSLGKSCRVTMPCPVQGPIWLEIVGAGFVAPPHLVSRPLAVSVNGTRLAEFDTDAVVRLHVPVLADTDTLVIEFHHPICPSPQAMGVSGDGRALGVMFERVALRVQ